MEVYKVIIDYLYSDAEKNPLFKDAVDAVINNEYSEYYGVVDASLSNYGDIVQYDEYGMLYITDTSTISDTTLACLREDLVCANNTDNVIIPMLQSIISNKVKYLAQVKKFYTVTSIENHMGNVMITLECI
jgi:hypothetical protein